MKAQRYAWTIKLVDRDGIVSPRIGITLHETRAEARQKAKLFAKHPRCWKAVPIKVVILEL